MRRQLEFSEGNAEVGFGYHPRTRQKTANYAVTV
jgi:hypothetical protein